LDKVYYQLNPSFHPLSARPHLVKPLRVLVHVVLVDVALDALQQPPLLRQ
jgi:hypothetical protein